MKKSPRTVRGGRKLALSLSIASQFLALLRNIAVARIIGPAEFGLAAIIILTLIFFGSLSNAGPQNLLVQAKDEDPQPLLDASHAVTMTRGVSTAALILVGAGPVSELFGLRISLTDILGLSLAMLIVGFVHNGVRLVQRDGDFRLDGISQVAGDVAALAAAVVIAILTHSHVAIVAGLVARHATMVSVTHLLAPQPYRYRWDRQQLRRFWAFGWPLLINGPLMFLSSQADRLFISRELGATTLGLYSAALVLVASPSGAILKWLQTIFVPPLAARYHAQGHLKAEGVVFQFTGLFLLFAALMLAGFAALGGFFVHLFYGSRYDVPAAEVALIGCLQMFRFLRAWPSGLSLSIAASGGILASTAVRFMALPIGYAGVVLLGGLSGLLIGFIVGEVLAFAVSLLIVNRNGARPRTSGLLALGAFGLYSAAVVWAVQSAGHELVAQLGVLVVASAVGLLLPLTVSVGEALHEAARLRELVAARVRRRLSSSSRGRS